MKICELKINYSNHRATIVSILAEAGYEVSVDKRKDESAWPRTEYDYFVIVGAAQAGEGGRDGNSAD